MARTLLLRGATAAALLLAPSALFAAPKSAGARGSATVLHPVTLVKNQDMDFGILAVTTGGTAVLDPATGKVTPSAGVTVLGGTSAAALFTGAASGGSVVNIKFTNQAITLTRVGGTETLSLSNLTMDGPSKRTMAKTDSFQFHVGGTLTVSAGQVQGSYVGRFDVTAQYQ
jgi:hypothetical protein